jgi:lactobin A/cerein 7B family class IIb bacteriocin
MKNLQNYGVQELNAKEMKTTDGGIIPLALLGLYVADALILGTMAGYAYGTMVTHNH